MLHVNLLPEDRQSVERTPLPRFLILLLGVALITGELAAGLWGYVRWQNLTAKKNQLQQEKQDLQPAVETYQKLKKDIENLERRKNVLEEISPGENVKEQYQWSYALDKLFDVIDQSPGVWIQSLEGAMVEGEGRGAGSALVLSFDAISATYLERMTNFTTWIKKRLIEKEKVFTQLEKDFRQMAQEEGGQEKKKSWRTSYTLKKQEKEDQGN